jgi:hypothetical protein
MQAAQGSHPLSKHPDALVVKVLQDAVHVPKRLAVHDHQHRLPAAAQSDWALHELPYWSCKNVAHATHLRTIKWTSKPSRLRHTMISLGVRLLLQRGEQASQALSPLQCAIAAMAPVCSHHHADCRVPRVCRYICRRACRAGKW